MHCKHPSDSGDQIHDRVAPSCEEEAADTNLLISAQRHTVDWRGRKEVKEAPAALRSTLINGTFQESEQRCTISSAIMIAPDRRTP